jgi:hypothetical protein
LLPTGGGVAMKNKITKPQAVEVGSQEVGPAERIKQLYEGVKISYRTTVDTAWEIGNILNQQKEILGHGKFGKWFEEIDPGFGRTIGSYWMKMAKDPKDKFSNIENLTEAYKLLFPPQKEREEQQAENRREPRKVESEKPLKGTYTLLPDKQMLDREIRIAKAQGMTLEEFLQVRNAPVKERWELIE